jgi:DNA-directed RNA polymerase specialized sigma24 family protein
MKDWVLTTEAFDQLLGQLDADRERAGEKYERIRQKLMKFFKWRGCQSVEEYTDRTIDRVTRKIVEGADLHVSDPYLYFHGVALNVLREHWREPARELGALDELPAFDTPAQNPYEQQEQQAERLEKEQRLDCLNDCVRELSAVQLDLITRYHETEGLDKARRKQLADSLGLPMNALRIRAYRIRVGLETCVENCLRQMGSA